MSRLSGACHVDGGWRGHSVRLERTGGTRDETGHPHPRGSPSSCSVDRAVRRGGAGRTRLPGTDGILFPNGVALDARGNIYATDSIGGSVWRISPGSSAELWFQSPLIAGDGSIGLGFPLGANGIAYRSHSVVVTN